MPISSIIGATYKLTGNCGNAIIVSTKKLVVSVNEP